LALEIPLMNSIRHVERLFNEHTTRYGGGQESVSKVTTTIATPTKPQSWLE
jgi:hypothetical protein